MAAQRPDVDRWLKGQGVAKNAARFFEDKETGRTLARPAFDALQTAIFNGEIKTVVVWKLDRLSRKQRDGINILADWCEQGVRVVSVTQQLDLSGTIGRTIAAVLFGLGEIELEHNRERQAAGIEAAKKRGVYANHSRPKGSFKSDPKRAVELREQGIRPGEIAKMLGVSRSTVYGYFNASS